MTILARRSLLAAAVIVFMLLAVLFLSQTGGWRFINGQVVRSGGLFVDSRPKASVYVDGALVGTTPYRSTSVATGVVTVTLRKSGYYSFTTRVRIERGMSSAVAPVRLFPSVTPTEIGTIESNQSLLFDQTLRDLVVLTKRPDGLFNHHHIGSATEINDQPWPIAPTDAVLSSDGTKEYLANETEAGVTEVRSSWWTVPVVTWPTWAPDRSAVFFGLSSGNLLRIDVFAHTIETLRPASSVIAAGGQLWGTSIRNGVTEIWKMSDSNAPSLSVVGQLNGQWSFVTGATTPILENSNDRRAVVVSGNSTLGYRFVSLGQFERLFTSLPSTPLLWAAGPDLFYRHSNGRAVLVDRFPAGLSWASWYQNAGTLVVSDDTNITIYNRFDSGLSVLARTSFPHKIELIGSLPNGEGFYYRDGASLKRWSWRSR